MAASDQKRACLIYVPATAAGRATVFQELEAKGYSVCEVEATLGEAKVVQSGLPALSEELRACLADAELCVFLLPENAADDAGIELAADAADGSEKRIVGVVAGARAAYPQVLDDGAESMLRVGSKRLAAAIAGESAWEAPGGTPATIRPIKRVRCQ
jgi:hypothetical protein